MSLLTNCAHAQKVMINCEDKGSMENLLHRATTTSHDVQNKQQALLMDVSQHEPPRVVAKSTARLHAVRVSRTGTASAQALAAVLAALPRVRSFRLASE